MTASSLRECWNRGRTLVGFALRPVGLKTLLRFGVSVWLTAPQMPKQPEVPKQVSNNGPNGPSRKHSEISAYNGTGVRNKS